MLGDSFCKTVKGAVGVCQRHPFNPHAWGLFLQVKDKLPVAATPKRVFQSPCLGTLFARRQQVLQVATNVITFNPHAWGLFLQEVYSSPPGIENLDVLSIPMLGDSFCKSTSPEGRSLLRFLNFQSPCLGTLFASRCF